MSFIVYGSKSAWCAICHKPPAACHCERDNEGVIDLMRVLADATPPQPQRCPHCGALLTGSTPAADAPKETPPPVAAPKKTNETWHDREPLL